MTSGFIGTRSNAEVETAIVMTNARENMSENMPRLKVENMEFFFLED